MSFKFSLENNYITLSFKYNPAVVDAVKTVRGRRWDPSQKVWRIPADNGVELLQALDEFLSEEEKEALEELISSFRPKVNITFSDNSHVLFSFPYNERLVAVFRSLRGHWVKAKRAWELDLRSQTEKSIKELFDTFTTEGFTFSDEEKELILEKIKTFNSLQKLSKATTISTLKEIPTPEGLKLRPYQIVGVEWIENHNWRAIIGDQMRLGKTVMLVCAANRRPDLRPILVVTPSTPKWGWYEEIQKWKVRNEKVFVVQTSKDKIPSDVDYIIISYSLLEKKLSELLAIPFKVLVLDEAHYIKNRKAKRTKAVKRLAKHIPHTVALTGTPATNRPIDLWEILNTVDPESWNNFWEFVYRYCDAKKTRWGWDFSGASNLDELQKKLRTIMLRRTQKDVWKEMPEKTRVLLPIEGHVSSEMERLQTKLKEIALKVVELKKARKEAKETDDKEKAEEIEKQLNALVPTGIGLISKLRQLAFELKKQAVLQFIFDILEQEEKVVVFVYHRKAFEFLKNSLEGQGIEVTGIIGGMSSKQKNENKKKFQEGSARVFLATLGSGTEGISLAKANIVVFAECDWTPKALLQAEDRVMNIEKEGGNVTYYYLVGKGTIEAYIMRVVLRKMEILDKMLDRKDSKLIEDSSEMDLNFFDLIVSQESEHGNN